MQLTKIESQRNIEMITSSSFNCSRYLNRNIETNIGQGISIIPVRLAKLIFGLIVFNFFYLTAYLIRKN